MCQGTDQLHLGASAAVRYACRVLAFVPTLVRLWNLRVLSISRAEHPQLRPHIDVLCRGIIGLVLAAHSGD